MTRQEALRLLELEAPYTGAALDRAYHEALTTWHPSSFAEDPALLSKAMEQTILVHEAHEELAKEVPPEEMPKLPPPCDTGGLLPSKTLQRLTLPTVPQPGTEEAAPEKVSWAGLPSPFENRTPLSQPANLSPARKPTPSRLQLPERWDQSQIAPPEPAGHPVPRSSRRIYFLVLGMSFAVVWVAMLVKAPTRAPSPSPPSDPGIQSAGHAPEARLGPSPQTTSQPELSTLLQSYMEAAERGDPAAQRELGKAYRDGRGVAKNLEESSRWFKKAEGK